MDNDTFDLIWDSLGCCVQATETLGDKLCVLQTKMLELHIGKLLLPPQEPEENICREKAQILQEYREAISTARITLDRMEKEIEEELGPDNPDNA